MAVDKKSITADRTPKAAYGKFIGAYKRSVTAHKSFIAGRKKIHGCLQEVYSGR